MSNYSNTINPERRIFCVMLHPPKILRITPNCCYNGTNANHTHRGRTMVAHPHHVWTEEDYLDFERSVEPKHEFYQGQVYAMAGASEQHTLIATNIAASLNVQLKGRDCRVYQSDLRVKVGDAGLYAYPDVTVVCGERQFIDEKNDTITNPTVLIEVLSPSTENYDRGTKFRRYRALQTFQEYVLVDQDVAHIEHYQRQPDGGWVLRDVIGLDSVVELPSIGCTLALTDVYDKSLPKKDDER